MEPPRKGFEQQPPTTQNQMIRVGLRTIIC
jgi:hypothetical protein